MRAVWLVSLALLGSAGASPVFLGRTDDMHGVAVGVAVPGGNEPRRALQELYGSHDMGSDTWGAAVELASGDLDGDDVGSGDAGSGDMGSGDMGAPPPAAPSAPSALCPELQFTLSSVLRTGHVNEEWCFNVPDRANCENYYVDPVEDFDPTGYAAYPFDCSQGCGRCVLVGDRCTAGDTIVYGCPPPPAPPTAPTADDMGSGDDGDVGSGDIDSGDIGSGDIGSGDIGSGDIGSGDIGSGDTGSPPPALDMGSPPPAVDMGSPPPAVDMSSPPPAVNMGSPPPAAPSAPSALCPELQFTLSSVLRTGHVNEEWCFNVPDRANCENYYVDPVEDFDPTGYAAYPFDCSQGCGRCVLVGDRCTAGDTIVYGCPPPPAPPPAPPTAPTADDMGSGDDGDVGSGDIDSGDIGSGDIGSGDTGSPPPALDMTSPPPAVDMGSPPPAVDMGSPPAAPSAPSALCPELQFTLSSVLRTGHVNEEWCFNVPDRANCENYYIDPVEDFDPTGYAPYPFDCSQGCGRCVLVGDRCTAGDTIVYGCPPPPAPPTAPTADDMGSGDDGDVGSGDIDSGDIGSGDIGSGDIGSGDTGSPPPALDMTSPPPAVDMGSPPPTVDMGSPPPAAPSAPSALCPELQFTLSSVLRTGHVNEEWCFNVPDRANCENYYVDPVEDFDPTGYAAYPFDCSQGCGRCVLVGDRCTAGDTIVYGCPPPPAPPPAPPTAPTADDMGSGDDGDVGSGDIDSGDIGSGDTGSPPPALDMTSPPPGVDMGSPPPAVDMGSPPAAPSAPSALCPELQFTLSSVLRTGHVNEEWCFNVPDRANCENYYVDPVEDFDPTGYAAYPFDCSQGCGRCVLVGDRCTAGDTIVYGCPPPPAPPPAPPTAPTADDMGSGDDGDVGSGDIDSGDIGSGDTGSPPPALDMTSPPPAVDMGSPPPAVDMGSPPAAPSAPSALCPELQFTLSSVLRTGHVNEEWCFNVPDRANCENYYVDPVEDFDPTGYAAYPFDCSQGCGRCVLVGDRCTAGDTIVYGCPPPPAPPTTPTADDMGSGDDGDVGSGDIDSGDIGSGDIGSGDTGSPPPALDMGSPPPAVDMGSPPPAVDMGSPPPAVNMGSPPAAPSAPSALCPELQFTLRSVLRTGHVNEEWCFNVPDRANCENYYVDPVEDFDPTGYAAYPFDCSQGCGRCVLVGDRCTAGDTIVYGCPPPPAPPTAPTADDIGSGDDGDVDSGDIGSDDTGSPPPALDMTSPPPAVDMGTPPPAAPSASPALCPELQFTLTSVLRTGHVNEEWCFNVPDLANCENYYIDPVEDFDPAGYAAYPFDCSQGCGRCVLVGDRCTASDTIVYGCPPPPTPPIAATQATCPELQFTVERTRRDGQIDGSFCWNAGVDSMPFSEVSKAVCESFYIDPVLEAPAADGYEFDCSLGCMACVYAPVDGTDLYRCTKGPIVTGCPVA